MGAGVPSSPPGYIILEELGRGGMGVVYRAKHEKLQRIVALKMILAGSHASRDALQRFRVEAEAIASLQHPLIVQIYEIGEFDGLPYFSLEFCSGGALDRRLRKLKNGLLSARPAAELVEKLAGAMGAAHQKGIVHRDLKPGNILLGEDDSPKITDFGLAKRLDPSMSGEKQGGLTHANVIMGSPSYMAPEQAFGKTKNVGPAADIYALGGILYDCLTGRPPFRGASQIETLDQVRHQEPLPPHRLTSGIPSDLETICLKCLRKEPAARYTSAADLQADLRRFLDGKPILARPIGPIGRARKWMTRNPAVTLLLSSIFFLILTSLVVITSQWRQALVREKTEHAARIEADEARRSQEVTANENAKLVLLERDAKLNALEKEQEAVRSLKKAKEEEEKAIAASAKAKEEEAKALASSLKAKEEEGKALSEAYRTRKSLEFLTSLFRVSDPFDFGGYALRSSQEQGRKLTAFDLLERGSKQINVELKDQPLVRATLLATIGDVYRGMGEFDKALKLLEDSLSLRSSAFGPDHPEVAAAMFNIGWLYLDRGDFDKAEGMYRQALKIQEEKLPKDDPATVNTRLHIAWVLAMDSLPEAEPLLKNVMEARTKLYGPLHRETIIVKGGLAGFYFDQGKPLQAFPLLLDLKQYVKQTGSADNFRAVELFQDGLTSKSLGFYVAAQKSLEEALKVARNQLGENNIYLVLILHELSAALSHQDKFVESEKWMAECLKVMRATAGLEHPRARIAIVNHVSILLALKKPKEAIELLDEALQANANRFGPQNRWRFFLLIERCILHAKQGNRSFSERDTREAIKLIPLIRGKELEIAVDLNRCGVACDGAGMKGLAEEIYQVSLVRFRQLAKPAPENFMYPLRNYATLLNDQGRYRESVVQMREWLDVAKKAGELRTGEGADDLAILGRLEMRLGRVAEADKAYEQALAIARTAKNYSPTLLKDRIGQRAGSLIELGKYAEAIPLIKELASVKTENNTFTINEGAMRSLAYAQSLAGDDRAARQSLSTLLSAFSSLINATPFDTRAIVQLRIMRTLLVLSHPGKGTTDDKVWFATAYLSRIKPSTDGALAYFFALSRLKDDPAASLLARLLRRTDAEETYLAFRGVSDRSIADHPVFAYLKAVLAFEAGHSFEGALWLSRFLYGVDHCEVPDRYVFTYLADWPDRLEARFLKSQLLKRLAH